MNFSNIIDPIKLEIFKSLYRCVAEEMGLVLKRTAFSPNIKERRDYSCAVFGKNAELIAQGDHMPVHLGSMPMSVIAAIKEQKMLKGDVVILNDPFKGGTHLPDLTMIAPVYIGKNTKPSFYVANRAHHADIGGSTPGSMGQANEIYQEGLRIPPIKLIKENQLDKDIKSLFLSNVRLAEEREGDLTAQIGAISTGINRLQEIIARYGEKQSLAYANHLIAYSARMMKDRLIDLPNGTYYAEDYLDDDGNTDKPIKIAVTITIKDDVAHIDFSGTDKQCSGPINAVLAITVSAVFYVFRCLLKDSTPANAGILEPITITAPLATIVNAVFPSAVAAGNVETSQRIVDVLLKALSQALPNEIPAASQGTMNNLTIGGINTLTNQEFAYYETIAGGMGARPMAPGLSGVHTHMTNSLNTPIEALEYAYPLRVRRYKLRANSGGKGQFQGGDGIIREIELLSPAQVTLLSDRRKFAPYGLSGAEAALPGKAYIITNKGTENLSSKQSIKLNKGEKIVIETPGGGGYGLVKD
ncbi:MAG: hydantoinase B/oxoprolinase family protein [Acidobacteria bacterium]|nr:hydantoinase B/oxoprolinase family protein [Acidobacteriota bacterium]